MDVTDADFDPWSPSHLPDPYAVYARMRAQDPVHHNAERGLWFLTRYDDVMAALKDHRRLSTAQFHIDKPHMRERPADGKRYQAFTGPTMLTTEPPEQTRLRRPASTAFAARAMQQLRGPVETVAEELLDRVDPEFDLLADFAYPLPIIAIAELLGIPGELRERFLMLATSTKGSPGHDPNASRAALEQAAAHGAELRELLTDVITYKRGHRAEDLISHLIEAEAAGEMSVDEMADTVHLMMEAGHITTVNLIGNGIDVLLDRPGSLERLHTRPDLVPGAVEECLRYVGPVHFTGRTALEDVVISDQKIPAGDAMILLLAAANRDPDTFDDAERFILERPPSRNLALGMGAHVCIGAALARLETRVALGVVARRLPKLRRAGEATWGPSFELRGLTTLPVAT